MSPKAFCGLVFLVLPLLIETAPTVQETCNFNWKKVGCYHDNVKNRPLPKQLVNIRDPLSIANSGSLLKWNSGYRMDLYRLACKCAQKATEQRHSHFGLQFYGECWSGDWKQADAKVSQNCVMPDKSGLPLLTCDDRSSRNCVGGGYANYIYELGKFTQAAPVAGNTNNMKGPKILSQIGSGRKAARKKNRKRKGKKMGKGKNAKGAPNAQAASYAPGAPKDEGNANSMKVAKILSQIGSRRKAASKKNRKRKGKKMGKGKNAKGAPNSQAASYAPRAPKDEGEPNAQVQRKKGKKKRRKNRRKNRS